MLCTAHTNTLNVIVFICQFVVYMQAVPWSLRLKLIAQINLNRLRLRQKISLSMMTSQDRICVQCVTNDLQGKDHWMFTNKHTKSLLPAKCVTNGLQGKDHWMFTNKHTKSLLHAKYVRNGLQWSNIWMNTDEYTLKRRCIQSIHAVNVRKVFHYRTHWIATRIFTLVNTNAQNVANVV